MSEKKNKKNLFISILSILFIIYLGLFFMESLGYYNVATKNKVLTEQKLIEFEQDVKNGKEIDIKEYVKDTTNYKNIYSDLGYNLSVGIDNVLNKGLIKVGKVLKKLFK